MSWLCNLCELARQSCFCQDILSGQSYFYEDILSRQTCYYQGIYSISSQINYSAPRLHCPQECTSLRLTMPEMDRGLYLPFQFFNH